MMNSMFGEELMQWARVIHRGLAERLSTLPGLAEVSEQSVDIADTVAAGDITDAGLEVGRIQRHYSQPGLLAVCLGFTAVIGRTSVEQRADMHHLVDVFAFPDGKVGLDRGEREDLRHSIGHGLSHAVAWLEFHDTDPEQAVAYWLMLAGGPYRVPVEPCAAGLTVMLACLAGRRRRPQPELPAAPIA